MFYYYGRKEEYAKLYPVPKYKTIIEPFAGSACYSLLHWKREVILIDKYEVIIKIWKFLQRCTAKDILALPKLEYGQDLRRLKLSEGEELLLGFYAGLSAFSPLHKVSTWGAERFTRLNSPWAKLARNIHKIKHWDIRLGDYTEAPDIEATWFIDPPYINGGHKYIHGNKDINYETLGSWSLARCGQVIVCEADGADWLPFKHLSTTKQSNANKNRREVIWTNHEMDQKSLFNLGA